MRPTDAPVAIVLRRPLTPKQLDVLDLMTDAPSYDVVALALHITPRTVQKHVLAIADVLPVSFAPDAAPKERVVIYAIRTWALGEIARARGMAA